MPVFGGVRSLHGRRVDIREIPPLAPARLTPAEEQAAAAAEAEQIRRAGRERDAREAVERARREQEIREGVERLRNARDLQRRQEQEQQDRQRDRIEMTVLALIVLFILSSKYLGYYFQPFRETSVETGDDLDLLQQALNVLKNKIDEADFTRIQNMLTKMKQKDSSVIVDINKYNSELKQKYPEYEKLKDLNMAEIRSQIKKILKKTDKTNLNFRSKKSKSKSKKSKSKTKKSKSKKSKSKKSKSKSKKSKSKTKKSKAKKSLRKVRK